MKFSQRPHQTRQTDNQPRAVVFDDRPLSFSRIVHSGQPTTVADRTNSAYGYVKGQARRFIVGHNARGQTFSDETRRKMSAATKGRPKTLEHRQRISAALKGHIISPETARKIGEANRGRPVSPETRELIRSRRIGLAAGPNHYGWKGERVSYSGLHHWVGKNKVKTGICEDCRQDVGNKGRRGTQWANISGEYRRDLDDFRELCPPCHRRFDGSRRKVST
jgi:hypothetical protein